MTINNFNIVVKAIIQKQGKILIVKRSKDDNVNGGEWEFPGGKLEFGELPEEALIREINEETSLKIDIIKLLYAWSKTVNENTQMIGLTFLCQQKSDDVVLSHEHSDFLWIKKKDVGNYLSDIILKDLDKINWFEK
jgi:8-oxo-dGTP diphosphatase